MHHASIFRLCHQEKVKKATPAAPGDLGPAASPSQKDGTMKFFPPRRPDRDEAEQAYEQLVKRAGTEAGQPIKPERKAGRHGMIRPVWNGGLRNATAAR